MADRKAVRFEIEYDDGQIEFATGSDADAIMRWYGSCGTLAAIHGAVYTGPTMKVRQRSRRGGAILMAPNQGANEYCLCGWEGPDRDSYWKHLSDRTAIDAHDAELLNKLERVLIQMCVKRGGYANGTLVAREIEEAIRAMKSGGSK